MSYYYQSPYPEPFNQSAIQQKLGIYFWNQTMLRTAFTHSSYIHENPDRDFECNERLEFLGDRVLGHAIAQCLYKSHLNIEQGTMAQTLSLVVNNKTLANIARQYDLGQYMLMGSGTEKSGARNSTSTLAGLLEAVIGAFEQDRNYDTAYQFCTRLLGDEIDAAYAKAISAPQQVKKAKKPVQNKAKKVAINGKHPKSALQEVVWAKHKTRPKYSVIRHSGKADNQSITVNVAVNGQVKGKGQGKTKKAAETNAAQAALKSLA